MEGTEKCRLPRSRDPHFPQTIEEFGYRFNDEGILKNIQNGAPFEFNVQPDDRSYNQRHYDALGEALGEWVEAQLEERYNLKRVWVPFDEDTRPELRANQAFSRIYVSKDTLVASGKLLVLLQGSGVVRPGQWARSAIINDSLQMGSMFPYIERAQRNGWSVVILNPNENFVDNTSQNDENEGGKGNESLKKKVGRVIGKFTDQNSAINKQIPIPCSQFPEEHCQYVWENLISPLQTQDIYMVAHSYGGVCTIHLANVFGASFCERVKACAFTDSVHSANMGNAKTRQWLKDNTINWIRSEHPLDTIMPLRCSNLWGCKCLSAGDERHAYTSGAAFESVMKFLES